MMKLKYSICYGLDVHKNIIVATIVTTDKEGISEYKQKSFSSINSDVQNCMTVSNVGIASVLSDPFRKTASEILSYLLAHTADSIDEKAVRKLIKKGAKAKSDEIIEAIKGYSIEADQAKKLELACGHLDYLNEMITQTEIELYVRIKPYYEFVRFIATMPGMTELSSTIVLAVTGINMDIFDDAKHLCS